MQDRGISIANALEIPPQHYHDNTSHYALPSEMPDKYLSFSQITFK